jgi:hypothetical protein
MKNNYPIPAIPLNVYWTEKSIVIWREIEEHPYLLPVWIFERK